jgi:hypothetical protein
MAPGSALYILTVLITYIAWQTTNLCKNIMSTPLSPTPTVVSFRSLMNPVTNKWEGMTS